MPKPPKSQPKPRRRVGYTPEQIAAGAAARDRASSSTPRAVVDAFAPDPVEIHGHTLLPVTAGTILELQKIGCGLLRSDDPDDFSVEDLFTALLVFTTPLPKLRAIREVGKAPAAALALADDFPPALIRELAVKLNAHIVAAFATVVPHGAKDHRTDPHSPFAEAPTQGPGMAGSPG